MNNHENIFVVEFPSIYKQYGNDVNHTVSNEINQKLVDNIETILGKFRKWLYEKEYEDIVYKAEIYKADSFYMNSLLYIYAHGGKKEIKHPIFVGSYVTINCGYYEGKITRIIKIEQDKKKPYVVVIDGIVRKYKESQLDVGQQRAQIKYQLETNRPSYEWQYRLSDVNSCSNIGQLDLNEHGFFRGSHNCKIWIDPIQMSPDNQYNNKNFLKFWTISNGQPNTCSGVALTTWTPKKRTKGMMGM